MAKKTLNLGETFNSAMQFISTPTEGEGKAERTERSATGEVPEGYKANPLYIEKKSKHLQLLLQPSLYDKLKAKADREGSSVNGTLHRILEEALREE